MVLQKKIALFTKGVLKEEERGMEKAFTFSRPKTL